MHSKMNISLHKTPKFALPMILKHILPTPQKDDSNEITTTVILNYPSILIYIFQRWIRFAYRGECVL